MSKEMIVSVNGREKKIAILDNGKVTEFYIERGEENAGVAGNVYKGRVMRVLPGMQSAFVDVGLERDAFLYVSDFFDEDEEIERIVMEKAKKGSAEDAKREANEQIDRSRIEREKQMESVQELTEPMAESSRHGRHGADRDAPVYDERPDRDTRTDQADEDEVSVADVPAEQVKPDKPKRGGRGRGKQKDQQAAADEAPKMDEPEQPMFEIEFDNSDFERISDDSDTGDLFKDAYMQEAIIDRVRAVEFDMEIPETPAVGDLLAEVGADADGFERIADDDDVTPPAKGRGRAKAKATDGEEKKPAKRKTPAKRPAKGKFSKTSAKAKKDATKETLPDGEASVRESDGNAEMAVRRGSRGGRRRTGKKTDESGDDAVDNQADTQEASGNNGTDAATEKAEAAPEPVTGERDAQESQEEPTNEREQTAGAKPRGRTSRSPRASSSRSSSRDAGGREDTNRESGDRESSDRGDSTRESSKRESGNRESGNRESGNRETGNRESGNRESGNRESSGRESTSRDTRDTREPRDNRDTRGRRDTRGGRTDRPSGDRPSGRYDRNDRGGRGPQPTISDLLREGQEILVQIAKEPIAKKGARITSHIALPGRYLVYMPTIEHLGVSRKIESASERARLRTLIQRIRQDDEIPSGGFIVRTAGIGISEEDLRNDAKYLARMWADARKSSEKKKSPTLVHQDLDLVQRILRDQLADNFTAIRVDNEEEYLRTVEFINLIQPRMVNRVKLYTRDEPILDYYGVQEEIDKALKPRVWLKSGGYLVINQTEALVAIDVNTGKFVGKGNARLEDTITRTNMEAVDEIARQFRLRDLGGIIVLDLIDMEDRRNRNKVSQALQEALSTDRSPNKVLSFNDFGLIIMTRKRVKQSLERTMCAPCDYCEGAGWVKSPTTVCYDILAEARRLSKNVEDVHRTTLRIHPDVATALRNSEHEVLDEIESYLGNIDIASDKSVHQEQFDFAFV